MQPEPSSIDKASRDTVFVFTRNGMGNAVEELQKTLVVKFLGLLLESGELPAKMIFYTEGVRLACTGSPALAALHLLESAGVELLLCKTCLDYFGITAEVKVGIVGGMPDILETLQRAPKVISV